MDFALDFLKNIYQTLFSNPYELWGFLTSVVCVWLNARENIWGWPFAIVAAALYTKVFVDIRLPGDALLQIIYIILSVYGLYQWLFGGKNNSSLEISHLPVRLIPTLVWISIISIVSVAYLLKYLNGDIVYIDASTTTISLIAQWMMAQKYLENWLVWIFVDLLLVGVYLYKGIYLTAILYFIFLFLATMGYFYWKKRLI